MCFFIDFGTVWERCWEGFEIGLEVLGASRATIGRLFLRLVFRTLSKRALRSSWVRFWLDFEGFGRGLGRILGEFGEIYRERFPAPCQRPGGFLLVFHNARNLKNSDFTQGKCIFLENLIFRDRCSKVSKMKFIYRR